MTNKHHNRSHHAETKASPENEVLRDAGSTEPQVTDVARNQGFEVDKVCQLEIEVSDIDTSMLFYNQVFGWKPVPADFHNYLVMEVPKSCLYGISLICRPHSARQGGQLVPYFQVPDLGNILEKVAQYGGQVSLGPKKLPGYGTIYHVTDPDGQKFGLFVAQPNLGSEA